jgi:hypothetical protein
MIKAILLNPHLQVKIKQNEALGFRPKLIHGMAIPLKSKLDKSPFSPTNNRVIFEKAAHQDVMISISGDPRGILDKNQNYRIPYPAFHQGI